MKKVDVSSYFEKHSFYYDYTETVFIADWNRVPKAMADYLENFYELEWEDQGTRCTHCDEWFTYADMIALEDCYLCKDCAIENPDWVIEDFKFFITDLPVYPKAVPRYLKKAVEAAGWVPLHTVDTACKDVFESGLYAGMNDSPAGVVKLAREHLGDAWEGLFMIDDCNPFMVAFSLYLKSTKEEE